MHTPDAIASAHRQYLDTQEPNFNPATGLLQIPWHGPGYHTRVPNGTLAHPTRDNVEYAVALIAEGNPALVHRGEGILARILPLQELDPTAPTYGIWSWLVEEPLAEMRPPDWNWADFIGSQLAHLLIRHPERLSAETRVACRKALFAAAYSIFRRNVQPSYTNISIKGAIVTCLTGELLEEPQLTKYGLARARHFVEFTRHHGGFTEYNSPTYGLLVLREVERGLFLTAHPELRELLEWVRVRLWELQADSLHLPTGQICGPQSRAYGDLLPLPLIHQLESRLGLTFPRPSNAVPPKSVLDQDYLVPALPCPAPVRERILAEARETETSTRAQYVRGLAADEHRIAAYWKTPEACLGTINHQIFWAQCRPAQGYWREGESAVAVLRVRMKHDGQDFSSGAIWAAQEGPEVLAVCGLVTDKGDFHPGLDRPADGIFPVRGLELAIELTAPGVIAREEADGTLILAGSTQQVRIRPAFTIAPGFSVNWETVQTEGFAAARALVNNGAALQLAPAGIEAFLIGFHLEIEPVGSAPRVPPVIEHTVKEGRALLRSTSTSARGKLEVSAPIQPGPQIHFKG